VTGVVAIARTRHVVLLYNKETIVKYYSVSVTLCETRNLMTPVKAAVSCVDVAYMYTIRKLQRQRELAGECSYTVGLKCKGSLTTSLQVSMVMLFRGLCHYANKLCTCFLRF